MKIVSDESSAATGIPLLKMGQSVVDRFLVTQGDGDLTGVIEGACRKWVKHRWELSGIRETQSGTRAMCEIRSVQQSACWNEFHRQRIITSNNGQRPFKSTVALMIPALTTS